MNSTATAWKEISAMDGAAVAAELSRIIAESAKILPIIGKLRHRSKLVATEKDGAPLAKAREAATKMGAATSCVDNAAPHERVFCILCIGETRKDGSPMLEESRYDDLTYRQAVTLDKALSIGAKNPKAREAIHKYLTVTKYGNGWVDTVLERAQDAANVAPTPSTPPESETETPSDSATTTEDTAGETTPSNVVSIADAPAPATAAAAPAPAPCKSAPEATTRILDVVREACAGLTPKQLDMVRANLARAVNSPDSFAAIITPAEMAKAA
ncbi:hypothetical protein [Verrucomicrobium sp. BvORR034]|uniref:hypothetical protein n=1 Tax=Verrucomicrobium sp. BvORR034 TaxID=1396418 RepID=UPI0006796DDD|nr:hypothetical protein [Verrucomicrobium sp. BvORR034]